MRPVVAAAIAVEKLMDRPAYRIFAEFSDDTQTETVITGFGCVACDRPTSGAIQDAFRALVRDGTARGEARWRALLKAEKSWRENGARVYWPGGME